MNQLARLVDAVSIMRREWEGLITERLKRETEKTKREGERRSKR